MSVATSGPKNGWRWVAVIAVFTILVSLGGWQLHRLAWKEALIAEIDEKVASEPVDLALALSGNGTWDEREYRPVRIAGVFDHKAERHFFATHDGATGYYIYTPLRLDSGDYLFVNRGFVPFEMKDAAKRQPGQVQGRVEIVGLMRQGLTAKPSWVVPDNDPAKNIFYWKDVRAMRETAGLPPDANMLGFFVDANDAPNPGGLPIGGVTIIEMPNNHLQYAVTWFGLAFALVAVSAVWWRNSRRART